MQLSHSTAKCWFVINAFSSSIDFFILPRKSGGVPYPLLTNTELYKLLKTGYRMERPDMCCDEV